MSYSEELLLAFGNTGVDSIIVSKEVSVTK